MQFSIEQLLEPIATNVPCGGDLSFSSHFDEIAEARRADDPTLEQGEWIAAIKDADWQAVIDRCSRLLHSESKDLRIAVWLTEALGKTNGFGGLAQGCTLVARLLNQYWDSVHPQPEDGDQELRIGNLSWLITRLAQLLRETPVTHSYLGNFSTADFEAARALQAQLDRDPDFAEELGQNKLTLAKFSASQNKTEREFYLNLVDDFGKLETAWQQLSKVIDERLGVDGPAFTPVNESLEGVSMLVQRLARQAGILNTDAPLDEAIPATQEPAALGASAGIGGPIKTRAQALQTLHQVAEYFRRTEPHSPVAYLAATAVKWGDMPLHLWLRSVMKDGGELAHLEELLGLGTPGPNPTEPQ